LAYEEGAHYTHDLRACRWKARIQDVATEPGVECNEAFHRRPPSMQSPSSAHRHDLSEPGLRRAVNFYAFFTISGLVRNDTVRDFINRPSVCIPDDAGNVLPKDGMHLFPAI
jgi:hypothetical protein